MEEADGQPRIQRSRHEESVGDRIAAMANTMAGSSQTLWYVSTSHDRRAFSPIGRHGESPLEERAAQTMQWIFCLFNIPSNAQRIIEKRISSEFSELVENHFILWKELEATSMCNSTDAFSTTARRQVAYSHEVIYKSYLLWERLQDLLYLQALPQGSWYDASVPSEMALSYERAYEMRAMLSDPPSLTAGDAEKKKRDMEILVAHLLEQAKTNKFRKRGNVVYEQKHVCWQGARYATCAWVPAHFGSSRAEDQHTLESYVLYFCRKDLYPDMHSALVRCLPPRKLAEFLELCDESDFPFVKPARNLLSFKNGVYDTDGAGLGEFHTYGSTSTARISHLAAAKFFDAPMPEHIFDDMSCRASSWWDIDTPMFQCPAKSYIAQRSLTLPSAVLHCPAQSCICCCCVLLRNKTTHRTYIRLLGLFLTTRSGVALRAKVNPQTRRRPTERRPLSAIGPPPYCAAS